MKANNSKSGPLLPPPGTPTSNTYLKKINFVFDFNDYQDIAEKNKCKEKF